MTSHFSFQDPKKYIVIFRGDLEDDKRLLVRELEKSQIMWVTRTEELRKERGMSPQLNR